MSGKGGKGRPRLSSRIKDEDPSKVMYEEVDDSGLSVFFGYPARGSSSGFIGKQYDQSGVITLVFIRKPFNNKISCSHVVYLLDIYC